MGTEMRCRWCSEVLPDEIKWDGIHPECLLEENNKPGNGVRISSTLNALNASKVTHSPEDDGNLQLATRFKSLNPILFQLTLSLIVINFAAMLVLEINPILVIMLSVLMVLGTILFHGVSGVFIKILDNLKDINNKLDKD